MHISQYILIFGANFEKNKILKLTYIPNERITPPALRKKT